MSVADILKLIPVGIQIYKDLKSLFDESRKHVEQQKTSDRWATYIDPIHSLKISWPTKRWRITGNGNIAPDMYRPLTLQFKTDVLVEIPSIRKIGESELTVPFVDVTIMDGVDLKGYTEMMTKRLSSLYERAGGKLVEERLGTKIEPTDALIAHHIVFQNAVMWQIRKIKRYEDKMYIVCGQMIEAVPYLYIVQSDLPKIINSVAILGSKQ